MEKRGVINSWFLMFGLIPLLMVCPGCKPDNPPPNDKTPFVRLLKEQTFQSHLLNRTINYAVLLPKNYDKSNLTYPVVYLLHGFGDDESAWYQWGLINYYADLNESETIPMIYVMPQGFNAYWVNRYNGSFPYMDMFVMELVPHIDSLFRTVRDTQHRAVMGYSMGGYGAMILPAKNPEIFNTGVSLSMSFRTDQQYMDELQSGFNSQWGSIFGGIGASGIARLTDYYKTYSPFHFFASKGDTSLKGQNYFFDCGDDEESLIVTNNELHTLLRDQKVRHEFRVKNGAHNWDYWHKALPEALKYISQSVQGISYPDDPLPVDPGPVVPDARIFSRQLAESFFAFKVVVPVTYASDTNHYPIMMVLHDRDAATAELQSQQMLSALSSNVSGNKMPPCITVEIPIQAEPLSAKTMLSILDQVRSEFRTIADKMHTILLGNNRAGRQAYDLLGECVGYFNSCMLFDAELPDDAVVNQSDLSFYLDICDQGTNYRAYQSLLLNLRQTGTDHEYRVRQGTPTHDSFLIGLRESSGYMKIHL